MDLPTWLNTDRRNDDQLPLSLNYWFRTPMGLESIAAAEIEERLNVDQTYLSHRNVFVALKDHAGENHSALAAGIQTVDDAYQYAGFCRGLGRTKESINVLLAFFRESMPFLLTTFGGKSFLRLTVSFVGKRNFSRYYVENQLNEILEDTTSFFILSNEKKEPHQSGELRVRCHIEEDTAFVGIGLKDTPLHRRSWRNIKYPGQLHTPIAAAMVRSLKPAPGDAIIDPFCGSGTLIIESALQYPLQEHFAYDIDQEAIEVAKQGAESAGVTPHFTAEDSLKVNFQQDNYWLISNPPWDEKHQIAEEIRDHFMDQLARWVTNSNGAVLLLPDEMLRELQKKRTLPVRNLAQTRVRGKLASIVCIGGR